MHRAHFSAWRFCSRGTAGRPRGRGGTGTPILLWAPCSGTTASVNHDLAVINGSTFHFSIPRTSLMPSQTYQQIPACTPSSEYQLHGALHLSSCGSWVLPSPRRPELWLHEAYPSDLDFKNSTSFFVPSTLRVGLLPVVFICLISVFPSSSSNPPTPVKLVISYAEFLK